MRQKREIGDEATSCQCSARRVIPLLAIVLCLVISSTGALLAQGAPVDGAPGLGDPYYPEQGNSGYDVRHYDLQLRIEPIRRTIQGVARVELMPVVALRSFTFDLAGFDVLDDGGPMIGVDHRFADCKGHIVLYPFRASKFSTAMTPRWRRLR